MKISLRNGCAAPRKACRKPSILYGRFVLEGRGCAPDVASARAWFKRAADQELWTRSLRWRR